MKHCRAVKSRCFISGGAQHQAVSCCLCSTLQSEHGAAGAGQAQGQKLLLRTYYSKNLSLEAVVSFLIEILQQPWLKNSSCLPPLIADSDQHHIPKLTLVVCLNGPMHVSQPSTSAVSYIRNHGFLG